MKTSIVLILAFAIFSSYIQSACSKTFETFTDPPINFLPPTMMQYNPPIYIFSGFLKTFIVNVQSKVWFRIIMDIENACTISPYDAPFNPRIFVDTESVVFYYCPNKNLIYNLNPNNNFSLSGNFTNLGSLPKFNEVKFMNSPDNSKLLLLGIINEPNLQNASAHNYTTSYLVQIDLATRKVMKTTKMLGAHSEPIIDMKIMPDGEVVAVGEKLYNNQQKLNTYYIGMWTDTSFNRVIDFYIANSYGFIPKVALTADTKYIFYTNEKSIFKYNKMTGKIDEFDGVTLMTSQYTMNNGMSFNWEEIPFTLSSSDNSLYVYNQGNFIKLDITTLKKLDSIPLPVNVNNSSRCQFNFFTDSTSDNSLLQSDYATLTFPLNKKNHTGFFKKLLEWLLNIFKDILV